jgi:outer membrane autotransporter protein
LDVLAGGSLRTRGASMSAVPLSEGEDPSNVTLSDAGSTWENLGGAINIGMDRSRVGASNVLNIINGAEVISPNMSVNEDGVVNLGAGGLAGKFTVDRLTNNGQFNADFTDDVILDSVISGVGTLTKRGAGTLTLTGASSGYQGTTVVDGGALMVGDDTHPGASLAGDVRVNKDGLPGGAGTLGHVTIASGGTLSPGNSIGTINVADVTFDAGSTYAVEVGPGAGHSDRTVATGAATINGGTVKVQAGLGRYAAQTDYTILTAAGGRTGMFDGVTSNLAFLTPSLWYDADNVHLRMTRNRTTFASVGRTPNQRATGAGAESIVDTARPVFRGLLNLSAEQAPGALDLLSGDAYVSAKGMLLKNSAFVRDAVDSRFRPASGGADAPPALDYGNGNTASDRGPVTATPAPPPGTGRIAPWGSAFGSWGATESDGNAAGLRQSTSGFLAGVDGEVTRHMRLGVLAGYSHDLFNVGARAASGSSNNYHLGLYGGTQATALGVRGGIAYAFHDMSARRTIAFPGFADKLTAHYDASTLQAFGELSYRIDGARASLEPFANLAYAKLHTNAFTEQGGDAALHSRPQANEATFSTLGVRTAARFDLGSTTATVRGTFGWRHTYGDTTARTALAFVGGSDAFKIAGVPISKDVAVVRVGLDLAMGRDAALSVGYSGQFGGLARSNGAEARLDVAF